MNMISSRNRHHSPPQLEVLTPTWFSVLDTGSVTPPSSSFVFTCLRVSQRPVVDRCGESGCVLRGCTHSASQKVSHYRPAMGPFEIDIITQSSPAGGWLPSWRLTPTALLHPVPGRATATATLDYNLDLRSSQSLPLLTQESYDSWL